MAKKRQPWWRLITAIGIGIAVLGLLAVLFGMFINSPNTAQSVSGFGVGLIVFGVAGIGVGVLIRLLRPAPGR